MERDWQSFEQRLSAILVRLMREHLVSVLGRRLDVARPLVAAARLEILWMVQPCVQTDVVKGTV
jgi:hypothetical protein